ncbi:predicted protein [Pyrenophora tritici-repentis Pt-1C-BFP]|uniref:Uncharacterized protein n=1 Tax=Pyrenophora tritici-repentis (strain Pt-1C-BFP) TaxID=426418 RepID=B2W4K7_PYRTR|nr:uncharacterized protein PTRG_04557 [Pyrenophora tritici-repentis Pt-1C-BFP]EDU47464.1 predicted protein [Pyrenophora tritici-repentis Pt-1C-BFP]
MTCLRLWQKTPQLLSYQDGAYQAFSRQSAGINVEHFTDVMLDLSTQRCPAFARSYHFL